MVQSFVSILALALLTVSCQAFELQQGVPYRIQSVSDGGFLRVTTDSQLCRPLSPVVTDQDGNLATIWTPSWWNNMELFGIHFDANRGINTVTFEGGPTCYPVYNSYDVEDAIAPGMHQGVNIKVRHSEICLSSFGLGQSVNFAPCDGGLNQIWSFAQIERSE